MAGDMQKKISIGLVLGVLALTSVFLLWHLGAEPLQDYDEATYAEVVHEARADGNFISFTYGGAAYLKKPPLMFWAMAASEQVFGETPFAMRLPFALMGIALVAAIIMLAGEISGSYFVAAFAGAITLTTGPLMETARQVRMDVPVTFFIMAAVYGFVRGFRDSRWFLFFGLFSGLAVLCKSVIAVFAFCFAFFALLFLRRFDVLKNKQLWYGVAIFLLVVVPWHIAETIQFGLAFWHQYIGVEVFARTEANLFWTVTITNADLWRYLNEFVQPWLYVYFAALLYFAFEWRSFEERIRGYVFASVTTTACILAVFLLAATKAPTYLLPLYPFGALSIALSFSILWKKNIFRWLGICAALMLLVWGGVLAVYNAYHYNPYYSTVITMAVDEHSVGELLAHAPQNSTWYSYNDVNLGSIMFYSQQLHSTALVPVITPQRGSFIVVDTDAPKPFRVAFPDAHTTTLYQGPQVSLLRVE